MKTKIIYFLIGALLLGGIFQTKIETIDNETLALIERSIDIDSENQLWPGYSLNDYPLDVNYGKVEYKYIDGNISEQNPSVGVLALSAYPEESGPVIKVLPMSMVRTYVDPIGTSSKEEREEIYISILFHEGFHCFQMDNGLDIDLEFEDVSNSEEFVNILNKLDNDEKYQKLWIKEGEDLVDYLQNDNKDQWVNSYNERIRYLKEFLRDDYHFYMENENFYELIEGTARYVEDKILEEIRGKFIETDFDGTYYKGTGKFYTTGRLKCLILDKGENWKNNLFNEHKVLTDLLI